MKKIEKKLYYLLNICILFLLLICVDTSYAAKLKKGIYEIKNVKMGGGKMYVNENGKILLKEDGNCRLYKVNDLFTGDTVFLLKYYDKIYEESDWTENNERIYKGVIDAHSEYYTLDGELLNYDKTIIGVVDSNVFFDDGSARNTTLGADFKLQGLNDNSKGDYTYSMRKFGDIIVIDEISKTTDATRNTRSENEINISNYPKSLKIYFYDRRFNLLKTIDGYTCSSYYDKDFKSEDYLVVNRYNRDNDDFWISYNVVNKELNLAFEHDAWFIGTGSEFLYITFTVDSDNNIIDQKGAALEPNQVMSKLYDFKNQVIKDNADINTSYYNVRYKYDKEKLVSTILDDKKVLIRDTQISACIAFLFRKNKYYYIKTNTNKHYFYNDKGDRVKILNIPTDATCKILYLNDDYLFVAIRNRLIIYNIDFEIANDFDINYADRLTVYKVMNDRYYYAFTSDFEQLSVNAKKTPSAFHKHILLDKNLEQAYDAGTSFNIVNDKYLVETFVEKSRVLDSNLNVVYNFDEQITDARTLKVKDKIFIIAYSKEGIYIFNDNMNLISQFESANIFGMDLYGQNSIDFQLHDDLQYILINTRDVYKDKIDICDLSFNKIDSIKFQQSALRNINLVNKNLIIIEEGSNNYSVYKIGEGYVLKDFYYLGDFQKDHFTYANGFYYGFMDYDLNILCQYSMFDTFNDDIMEEEYW